MVGSLLIATLFNTTVGAFTIGMTVAAAAINFAVSYIVNRAFAPDVDRNQNQNNREQIPPTTDNSIPVVYGEAYLGGTFVDAVLTTDQQKMYYTLAISSISPNGQFTFDQTKFYYGGRLITFDPTEPGKVSKLTDDAGNEDTKIAGKLFIYLFTSTQAGVITAINSSGTLPSGIMSVANGVPSGKEWPASGRQMNGTAFAIVVLNYNVEASTTSLQPITFKVKHALNGTGVAKPGDVWYDYMTNTVYGCAVDPSYVDATSAATLNTYSDGLITYTPSGGGSATQARYRINGVLTGNVSALENIEKVLNCCDTWMTYNAGSGSWKVIPNKPETTAFAFNDSNIVGEIRVSATDITASVNQIEARFPFKENKDQPNFVFIQTPSALLYPNEPVNKSSVTYELVNDSVQAQYLANRVLEQAREDLIVSFNTTYYGIQVDAGDVVSVTNSDYGWSAKLFRVLKVNEASLPDGQLGARLEMAEYSAAVYDDFDITQYVPVPNSGIAAPEYFSPLNAPVVIASRPSAAVPSFDVQVSAASSGLATFISLFYTTSPTPSATDWQLLSNITIVDGVPYTPGASYTFLNQTLPTGIYYFSFVVGNSTSVSAKSPVSLPFNWAPVAGTGPTGPTGAFGPTGGTGPTGQPANQQAVAYLYQWSPTTPTNPSGSSTFTWSSGSNGSYTGGGGWSVTVPANPGTPGILLWVASKSVVDVATATTTTVSWASGYSVYASSGNGLDGSKTASVTVYQWAVTIPTISGTSTYTWATKSFTPVPSGWATSISASPSPGFTLWAAVVTISDTAAATTTSINWATASIIASGYSGTNGATGPTGTVGASARVMFARIAGNPTPVAGTVTVSGDNRPTGAQGSAVWGASFNVTWSATDPNPSSNDSLYQSDGIYNGTNTSWSTPYISSLKVGTLSAITVNTGALTVQDSITVSTTGNIKGGQTAYATGTGFFLGYSGGAYKFSIGNSTDYLGWDGTQLKFTGDIDTNGDAYFFGKSPATSQVIFQGTTYNVDFSVQAAGLNGTAGTIRSGVFAYANSSAQATWDIAVLAQADSTVRGVGILADGGEIGGYFNAAFGGKALVVNANNAADTAIEIPRGRIAWNAYTILPPSGSTTTFLRNDGTWATPAGGSGTVTSVSGTGTVSGITLSGTVTTSGNLTLGGSLSLTASNLTATAPGGGPYYLASTGWQSVSPIMTSAATNSGTAVVSANTLSLLGSTSTGIAGAYVGTTGSGATVTFDIRTTSPSDRRLKQDIEDSDLGLAFVSQLKPKKYRLKADPRQQIGYGFIADEVAPLGVEGTSLVYHEPDWKVGEETGFDTIHYPSYIAVLTKAIQELNAKVETLQAEIAALKAP